MSTIFDRVRNVGQCKTPEEWEPVIRELFEDMDADKDGSVSREEHAQYCKRQFDYFFNLADEAKRAQMQTMMDAVMSDPNHQMHPSTIFNSCDTDNDGVLSFDELLVGMVRMMKLGQ